MSHRPEHETTRMTPVPGHARSKKPVRTDDGYVVHCACGWDSGIQDRGVKAIHRHTLHKGEVRSGLWAARYEAEARADVDERAEPYDLINEVNHRIDARAAGFIALFDYRKK